MMRRLLATVCVGLLGLTLAPAGAAVPGGGRLRPDTNSAVPPAPEGSSRYLIVELRGRPLATYRGGIPGYARTAPRLGDELDLRSRAARRYSRLLAQRRGEFIRWLERRAPRAEVMRVLDVVANAVVIRARGVRTAELLSAPNVRRVSPSTLYRPAMNVSNGLIDADPEMWAQVGGEPNAGAGIKVAIIDTGIDITNPFFDDAGYSLPEGWSQPIDECGPELKPGGENVNNKVIVCRVYASGNTGRNRDGLVVFDHGTHVAGTVAGNEDTTGRVVNTEVEIANLGGVAPNAWLGDYNVFPGFGGGYVAFDGSAFSHDIAEAIEDALADGMDVANLSLGGSVQGPNDFLAEAVNRAARAGMVVVAAAGNSGPGDATVQSPGTAERAITVGASTNPHFVGIPVTVAGQTYGAALGDFHNFVPASDYADLPFSTTTPANGCSAIEEDLSGQIAVIDRGVCSFTTKVVNAQNAGAKGVIVVNNVGGDPTAMAHDGTVELPDIPAAMVSRDDGTAIKEQAGEATMTVDGESQREFVTDNADILAGFSSWGPAPFTYIAKPDVTAPGVNVLSSVFDGGFAFFQGTSMATPHVAGAAALLLQAHPGWGPQDVRSALVTTAKRPVFDPVTGSRPVGVLQRGGGRIDVDDASGVPVTLDHPLISLGYFAGKAPANGRRAVTATNVSSTPQACSLEVEPAGAPVTVTPDAFELASGASTTFVVSFNGGRNAPSGDYQGDVVLDCTARTLLAPWFARVDRKGR